MNINEKLKKAQNLLEDYVELYEDGAICCDCQVEAENRPKECLDGPCGILNLYMEAKGFLGHGKEAPNAKS